MQNDSYEEQSENLECFNENISEILEKILKTNNEKLLKGALRKIREAQDSLAELVHHQTIIFGEKLERLDLMIQYLFEKERMNDEDEKMRYLLKLD
jgi:hypothetical protein